MADWCSLPAELVYSISLRLPTSIDILRFRSICTHWRSSVNPPLLSSSPCHPIIPCSGLMIVMRRDRDLSLTKRTIYALRSTSLPHVSCIMKLERRDDDNSMHPIHPLSESYKKPLHGSFPKSSSLMNFGVKELGQEYALRTISSSVVLNRVAVLNDSDDSFVLLTIKESRLVVYKSGNDRWWEFEEEESAFYDDVIVRGGRFYAVDLLGILYLVDVNMKWTTRVSNRIDGAGMKKFLVDCDGELLLVTMFKYMICGPGQDKAWKHRFEVYRLNENKGEWNKVRDLGNRVLFVGDHCAFSAYVSDIFSGDDCKGNRIFFMGQFRDEKDDDEAWNGCGVEVFDMESRTVGPLGSYPGYSVVFCPFQIVLIRLAPVKARVVYYVPTKSNELNGSITHN